MVGAVASTVKLESVIGVLIFPARSVKVIAQSAYVPSVSASNVMALLPEASCPMLTWHDPEKLGIVASEEEITTVGVLSFVRLAIGVTSAATGAVLSIFATVATAEPVFPRISENWKVNVPFAPNVWLVDPLLFVTVIAFVAPVRVAMTS